METPRKVIWLVDTLGTIKSFPAAVRQKLGFGLYQAQIGQRHENAKPLHGFAAAVWEVRADDPSGTYRAVYLVEYRDAVYVLHVFQKKSKSGISTPGRDIEVIRRRLMLAQRLAGQQGE